MSVTGQHKHKCLSQSLSVPRRVNIFVSAKQYPWSSTSTDQFSTLQFMDWRDPEAHSKRHKQSWQELVAYTLRQVWIFPIFPQDKETQRHIIVTNSPSTHSLWSPSPHTHSEITQKPEAHWQQVQYSSPKAQKGRSLLQTRMQQEQKQHIAESEKKMAKLQNVAMISYGGGHKIWIDGSISDGLQKIGEQLLLYTPIWMATRAQKAHAVETWYSSVW